VVEGAFVQAGDVSPQQPRDTLVADGNLAGSFQQQVERCNRRLGIEQPVLAGGAMKEQRRRVHARRDVEPGQQGERLVEPRATDQFAGQPEADGVALEGLDVGAVEPGGGCGTGRCGIDRGRPRVGPADDRNEGIERLRRVVPRLGRGRGRAATERGQPGGCPLPQRLAAWRGPRRLTGQFVVDRGGRQIRGRRRPGQAGADETGADHSEQPLQHDHGSGSGGTVPESYPTA